jgi:lipopolysaccharide/colanic/teichoic acid biosynthesis glycosyltransferase/GT2 family glycosyltransferase
MIAGENVPTSGPETSAERVRVSIVIPAHNAARTLRECLQALISQDLQEPYEIILVDDGSTDLTATIAREYGCRVRVLSEAHRGAAAARNAGIRAAQGEIVLFTDADCEPIPGWARSLVGAIREGADGAKGTYLTRQRTLTARFVQAEYEGKYRRMLRLSRGEQIDFIDTYSAAYRKDALVEVGGFDERISAVEDQELSFRLAERAYRLRFVPAAAVYHRHAESPQAYLRKKFWIGYWKVRAVALHPHRIVRDSHTPQSIKVQMLLLCCGLGSLLLAPFSSLMRKASVACGLGFLTTAIPFSAAAARRNFALALIAPAMMLVRAFGLSLGMMAGMVRFGRHLVQCVGYAGLKRAMDVGLSAIGSVLASPLMLAISLAVKLDSRGPALFVQWRAGRDGKPFRIYKFRTMVEGAECMHGNRATLRGLEETALKLRADPRVTRVGRFLRRWSLDELPQLWNVLKGEMSLVGPRPEELRVVQAYSPWHRQRLRATPGITGPMQVNGRADLSLDKRVQLELDYLDRTSIMQDAKILLRTVQVIISGEGSY